MSTILFETNTTFSGTLGAPGGGAPSIDGSAVFLDATSGGPAGSSSFGISPGGSITNHGLLYFVSDTSLESQSFGSGTWTVGIQATGVWSGGPYTVASLFLMRYTIGTPYSYQAVIGSLTLGTSISSGNTYTWNITGNAVTFGATDVLVLGFGLTNSGVSGSIHLIPSQLVSFVPNAQLIAPSVFIGHRRRHGAISYRSDVPLMKPPVAGPVPPPTVFIGARRRHGAIVYQTPLPMMQPAPMYPLQSTVFIGGRKRHGAISYQTPLMAPPVPGPVPPAMVFIGERKRHGVIVYKTPLMPVVLPTPVAGGVPPPTVFIGKRRRHGAVIYQTPLMPVPATTNLGVLILLRAGPSISANIPPSIDREPLYMTDTNQLFVCNTGSRHFIGGDFVTAPAHHNSNGIMGQTAWDGTNFYRCVATNTWIQFLPAGGFSTTF